jgi:two-component system KDP operon response regulator KdpE
MSNKRILVIDDDIATLKYIAACLKHEGYDFSLARDGQDGMSMVERENPELVILDIMMPKMDGFEVCRRVREWTQVPIIMLSSLTGAEEKVKCLNLGADDYLSKPFSIEELLARIRAVLRRTTPVAFNKEQPCFIKDDLEINYNQRKVVLKGIEIKLTPTEYSLLQELAVNAGKVLTQKHLLQKVWGPEYQSEREYLHVFIGRLRSKIEIDQSNPEYIITVPGVGYEFRK